MEMINEMTAAMMLNRLETKNTPRSIELFEELELIIDRNLEEENEFYEISTELFTAIYETLS